MVERGSNHRHPDGSPGKQIRTIHKEKRQITKPGSLNESKMNEIDKALKTSLSLH